MENANPYQPSVNDGPSNGVAEQADLSSLTRFRWHFALAFIVGICLTGRPIEWLTASVESWPMMALAMEFGPWAHPLNLIGSLFVSIAIPLLQVAKWVRRDRGLSLRAAQIGIWWVYWLMFGLAQQLGTWRGP
jgi:hypothetical protein